MLHSHTGTGLNIVDILFDANRIASRLTIGKFDAVLTKNKESGIGRDYLAQIAVKHDAHVITHNVLAANANGLEVIYENPYTGRYSREDIPYHEIKILTVV